ncbi:keratin, type I cytoskeletal 9-like [Ischnura elegans]|uniref:keratin, type I cytoskeletal 9-like n=1 Tax=Ischnura elegans TaxID=197161 RepID=UPI001ED8979F|nr:keratin, type I cytoskeletal 9-like [Ischnura elegans]
MKTLALCLVVALVGCAYAEPPSGYSYSRPSGGHHGGGGGASFGHSGGGGGFSSFGGGFQSNEGLSVDPAVLEQVRQILERNEVSSVGHGESSYYRGGHGGAVGIILGEIRPGIQVGQFSQQHTASIASIPSSSYGVPSSSYGAPARIPSSSYGAPSY